MSILFDTTRLHTLTLKNRFVRSATWTGTATADGGVTAALMDRMAALAEGGVGLIVSGHAFVSPEGQATPRQLAIYDDRFVDGLGEMTDRVHRAGGVIAAQLAHAGLYAFEGAPGPCRAVSPLESHPVPQQVLDATEIGRLIDGFVAAGVRAKAAGFDAVELHAAHGYLLSQFLSPFFNQRTDGYGGDGQGRARIHQEIIAGLRRALGPDYPILVKMNGRDDVAGGLTPDQAVEAALLMAEAGCNGVELSGGLLRSLKRSPSRVGISTEAKEAYFREDAFLFKKRLPVPLILVGGVRSFEVAEALIANGTADYLAMSRPLVCEPDLIARWRDGDRTRARCRSDNRCFKPGFDGLGVSCPHAEGSGDA